MYINCEQAHFENKTTSLFVLQILKFKLLTLISFCQKWTSIKWELNTKWSTACNWLQSLVMLDWLKSWGAATSWNNALQVLVYPWSWKVACLLIMRLRRNLRNVLGPLLVWGVLASGYSVRFTSRSTSMINRAENRTVKAVNKTLKVKDFE